MTNASGISDGFEQVRQFEASKQLGDMAIGIADYSKPVFLLQLLQTAANFRWNERPVRRGSCRQDKFRKQLLIGSNIAEQCLVEDNPILFVGVLGEIG